jgi:hypothetical protein
VEGNGEMFRLENARLFNHNFSEITFGGIHAIATGMHYSPTELSEVMWTNLVDKQRVEKTWIPHIKTLNKNKNKWEQMATSEKYERTYDFLKLHIYNESDYS